jgi:hypothetical protein
VDLFNAVLASESKAAAPRLDPEPKVQKFSAAVASPAPAPAPAPAATPAPSPNVAPLQTLSQAQIAELLALKAELDAQKAAQSVIEQLSQKSATDVLMGWTDSTDEEGNSTLTNTYVFSEASKASRLLVSVLERAYFHDVLSAELKTSASASQLTFHLSTHSQGSPSTKDVAIANYINYLFALYEASTEDNSYYYYGYSNPATLKDAANGVEVQKFRVASDSELHGIPHGKKVQCFSRVQRNSEGEEETQYFAKVPVAVIGEWEHPTYTKVSFSQEDYDQMQQNFASNVLGFEPPLFLGHPVNDQTVEGAPAEGFLTAFVQEGDALFGIYEIVDEETYSAVKKGKYRYASSEIIRDYTNPVDGESVGIVLFGHALTNRPFVPNLPRVSVLSEDSKEQQSLAAARQYITLSVEDSMNTVPASSAPANSAVPTAGTAAPASAAGAPAPAPAPAPAVALTTPAAAPEPTPTPTPAAAAPAPAPAPVIDLSNSGLTDAVVQTLSAQLKASQEWANGQIQTLSQTVAAQAAQIQNLTEVNRQKDRATAIAEVNAMCLAEEVKKQAIEKIQTDALGNQESAYLDMLRLTDAQIKGMALTQHGSAAATLSSSPLGAPPSAATASTTTAPQAVMPPGYTKIIEQNSKALEHSRATHAAR